MANDLELKAKVSEKVHDDFLVTARALGFATRSEFLRHLICRELYGSLKRNNKRAYPIYEGLEDDFEGQD